MYIKDKKINAVAESVVKILEAEEMKASYGDTEKEDEPAIRSHKAKPVNPKEYMDKLDKKYGKPSPYVGDVKEATEKPTHIVSKELLADHKRWMDSEGFDTHTVPLPKSHPKHATHVGIVEKNNNEAGYHEDGFARPIHESVDLEEGSGSKEKQKTPYRNINSPEYRAAANKQKEKMEKDDAATPGKKLLSRLKGNQYKLDKNHNGKLDAQDFKMLRGEKNESVESIDENKEKLTQAHLDKLAKLHGPGKVIKKNMKAGIFTYKLDKPTKVLNHTDTAGHVYGLKNGKLKHITSQDSGEMAGAVANESVESIDELSKSTVRSYANKKSAELSHVPLMPFKRKPMSDRENRNADKGMMGALKRLNKEEVEELDELSKDTLMSYVKKGEKQQGKNFDDILSAHKGNDQPKANKANAKYLKRNAGLDRAVDKMYAKYDKPKTKRVLQFEGMDEDLKGDMHPDADKVLKHIKPEFHSTYKPFLKKGTYKGNYADRAAVLSAAEKAGHTLNEKKGDSDLGTFTDNNMGEMTDAQMKDRERIVKSMKKNLAGFKERYGKRAKDVMYATATKQAMKDEAVDPKVKTTDTLAGRIKGGDENQHTSYKVKLKTEAMGCENTPMSRATKLAKAAYKKLKDETMMGKAGGTSEEKE